MRPGGANSKGREFEATICRELTEWITGSKRPELFWRSATSGAKATQDAKKGRKAVMGGDIMSIHPDGDWFTDNFSVEVKFRKDYDNLDMMFDGQGKLLTWWKQCVSDADRDGKRPLLVFKRNKREVFVAYRRDDFPDKVPPRRFVVHWIAGGKPVIICKFKDWKKAHRADLLRASLGI